MDSKMTMRLATIIIECDGEDIHSRVTDGEWKSIGKPRILFLKDGTAIMTAVFLCPGGRAVTTETDNELD